MKYTLTKTKDGKKNVYTVRDEAGNIVSQRKSMRDYVACTVDGSFYFGRPNLIGKSSDYKRVLATCTTPKTREMLEIVILDENTQQP